MPAEPQAVQEPANSEKTGTILDKLTAFERDEVLKVGKIWGYRLAHPPKAWVEHCRAIEESEEKRLKALAAKRKEKADREKIIKSIKAEEEARIEAERERNRAVTDKELDAKAKREGWTLEAIHKMVDKHFEAKAKIAKIRGDETDTPRAGWNGSKLTFEQQVHYLTRCTTQLAAQAQAAEDIIRSKKESPIFIPYTEEEYAIINAAEAQEVKVRKHLIETAAFEAERPWLTGKQPLDAPRALTSIQKATLPRIMEERRLWAEEQRAKIDLESELYQKEADARKAELEAGLYDCVKKVIGSIGKFESKFFKCTRDDSTQTMLIDFTKNTSGFSRVVNSLFDLQTLAIEIACRKIKPGDFTFVIKGITDALPPKKMTPLGQPLSPKQEDIFDIWTRERAELLAHKEGLILEQLHPGWRELHEKHGKPQHDIANKAWDEIKAKHGDIDSPEFMKAWQEFKDEHGDTNSAAFMEEYQRFQFKVNKEIGREFTKEAGALRDKRDQDILAETRKEHEGSILSAMSNLIFKLNCAGVRFISFKDASLNEENCAKILKLFTINHHGKTQNSIIEKFSLNVVKSLEEKGLLEVIFTFIRHSESLDSFRFDNIALGSIDDAKEISDFMLEWGHGIRGWKTFFCANGSVGHNDITLQHDGIFEHYVRGPNLDRKGYTDWMTPEQQQALIAIPEPNDDFY